MKAFKKECNKLTDICLSAKKNKSIYHYDETTSYHIYEISCDIKKLLKNINQLSHDDFINFNNELVKLEELLHKPTKSVELKIEDNFIIIDEDFYYTNQCPVSQASIDMANKYNIDINSDFIQNIDKFFISLSDIESKYKKISQDNYVGFKINEWCHGFNIGHIDKNNVSKIIKYNASYDLIDITDINRNKILDDMHFIDIIGNDSIDIFYDTHNKHYCAYHIGDDVYDDMDILADTLESLLSLCVVYQIKNKESE